MLKLLSALVLCLSFIVPNAANAAEFPARPINVIMPFGVGGASDSVIRVIADYLQKKHNVTLVIVPKPGGGGAPAMLDVLRARPDGYTISLTSANVLTVLPQYKNVGFKYTDLAHVCQVTTFTMGWAVRKDSGIDSFEDLMKKATAEKGVYSLGSPGAFSGQRFFLSTIMKNYPDADFPYVAFDGTAEVVAALLGKHITVGYAPVAGYIAQKELKTIAVSSPKRAPEVPDAATFTEILGPEYVYDSIYGIVAPPKTPAKVVQRLSELFAEAVNDPDVQKRLITFGVTPNHLSGTEFTKVLDSYSALFEGPIKEAIEASKSK